MLGEALLRLVRGEAKHLPAKFFVLPRAGLKMAIESVGTELILNHMVQDLLSLRNPAMAGFLSAQCSRKATRFDRLTVLSKVEGRAVPTVTHTN
jgi:hypothetical protein